MSLRERELNHSLPSLPYKLFSISRHYETASTHYNDNISEKVDSISENIQIHAKSIFASEGNHKSSADSVSSDTIFDNRFSQNYKIISKLREDVYRIKCYQKRKRFCMIKYETDCFEYWAKIFTRVCFLMNDIGRYHQLDAN